MFKDFIPWLESSEHVPRIDTNSFPTGIPEFLRSFLLGSSWQSRWAWLAFEKPTYNSSQVVMFLVSGTAEPFQDPKLTVFQDCSSPVSLPIWAWLPVLLPVLSTQFSANRGYWFSGLIFNPQATIALNPFESSSRQPASPSKFRSQLTFQNLSEAASCSYEPRLQIISGSSE